MKILLSTNIDTVVDRINEINRSDSSVRAKVSNIMSILFSIDDNYQLGLSSNNGRSVGLDVYKSGSKWIDPDGGYTYSASDIADEIVNGRYNTVVGIIDRTSLKTAFKASDRYTPSMWRK